MAEIPKTLPWEKVMEDGSLKKIIDKDGNTVASVDGDIIWISDDNLGYMLEALNKYPLAKMLVEEKYTGESVGKFITDFINKDPKTNSSVGWEMLKAWCQKVTEDRTKV